MQIYIIIFIKGNFVHCPCSYSNGLYFKESCPMQLGNTKYKKHFNFNL